MILRFILYNFRTRIASAVPVGLYLLQHLSPWMRMVLSSWYCTSGSSEVTTSTLLSADAHPSVHTGTAVVASNQKKEAALPLDKMFSLTLEHAVALNIWYQQCAFIQDLDEPEDLSWWHRNRRWHWKWIVPQTATTV